MSLIILFVEVDGNCELIASPKLFLSALIVFNDLSLSKIISNFDHRKKSLRLGLLEETVLSFKEPMAALPFKLS